MRNEFREVERLREVFFVRYDTRCYFNVRSKANMSELNLPPPPK